MITLKDTFNVEVEVEGEKAVLTFKHPKLNKLVEASSKEKSLEGTELVSARFGRILEDLVAVKDIRYQNGDPVTIDVFKRLDLPFSFLLATVTAYDKVAFPNREAGEKNESSVSA